MLLQCSMFCRNLIQRYKTLNFLRSNNILSAITFYRAIHTRVRISNVVANKFENDFVVSRCSYSTEYCSKLPAMLIRLRSSSSPKQFCHAPLLVQDLWKMFTQYSHLPIDDFSSTFTIYYLLLYYNVNYYICYSIVIILMLHYYTIPLLLTYTIEYYYNVAILPQYSVLYRNLVQQYKTLNFVQSDNILSTITSYRASRCK